MYCEVPDCRKHERSCWCFEGRPPEALAEDLAESERLGGLCHGHLAPAPVEPRELVGRMVRQVWVQWASEQPDPKPSWLLPWEALDDGQREVDMRIGEKLFEAGQIAQWEET